MIFKAVKEEIKEINTLGKLLYDNFEKIYLIENYLLDNNYIILIEKEKEINGFILVYKNIDYYELELIVVSKKCRKKGIATKLMNYFIDNFCQKDDIILLEVSCENIKAINLYKKFNFETINIRKKYYNNVDAYVMKKVI